MGYYSDVALLLGREADGELRVALVDAPEEVRQLFKGRAPEVVSALISVVPNSPISNVP